ncbi:MAG: aminoglycoside phosphotransferase family protein [Geminicoccaceae bacterium]
MTRPPGAGAVTAWLDRWGLAPDGPPIVTAAARLLPVRRGGIPAMLKLSAAAEEPAANALMAWWDGNGAARVLARDGSTVLLARAAGRASLAAMARDRQDEAACRILCAVAARLHAPRRDPPPAGLIPLRSRFAALAPAAAAHGGILARCLETAEALLAEPREVGPLHGDLHHDNVLDFGEHGWLAIDPHGLLGERGFDFANIFTNPDLADPTRPVATRPEHFARRLEIVAAAAGVERTRLLRWILAWAGLSAAWFLEDGEAPDTDLRVAELAAAELDRA